MASPDTMLAMTPLLAGGLAMASAAALRAWAGWLEIKRLEITKGLRCPSPTGGELRRLRERVRRLEAIASGTEAGV